MDELRIWAIEADDFPATAMVAPGTVPLLSCLLDPDAPWVYVAQHAPMYGFAGDPGWTSMRLPLSAEGATDPVEVKARYLHYDLLLPTSDFLRVAPEFVELGASVRQVQRPPDDSTNPLSNPHIEARRNWYRKFGLVVGFELPHKGEWAQVVAADGASLHAGLNRLRGCARGGEPLS